MSAASERCPSTPGLRAESWRDIKFTLLPYLNENFINPDSISNMLFFTRSQSILIGNNMCNQTLFVPSENMLYSMSYFPNTESSSGEFWNYII